MRTFHAVPILLAGALLGCAPRTGGPVEPRPADRYVLTGEEMRSQIFPSAFDALERLRPWLLQPLRGDLPDLYVDGIRQPIETLRTYPPDIIVEIRYVHGADAVRFWGGKNALVMTTNAFPGRIR